MDIELTNNNYIGIAMKYYDNVECNTIEEFNSDLYKIICIKKIIDRYFSSGKVNIQLLLNHVIILHNSFGPLAEKLLKLRLDTKYYPAVKSILVFLKYIDSDDWHDVYEDVKILNELRKI